MRKFSLFMLMAVGLLISGNLRAVTEVGTWNDLKTALGNGGEIKLTAGMTTTTTSTVTISKTTTLDLNGYSITANKLSNTPLFTVSADVTCKDSKGTGKVYSTSNVFLVQNTGTLSIESGIYDYGTYTTNSNAYCPINLNGGKLNVSGGTFTGTGGVAIAVSSGDFEITISGGNIQKNVQVMGNSKGTITVSGGEVAKVDNSQPGGPFNYNVSGGYIKALYTNDRGGSVKHNFNFTGGEFGFDPTNYVTNSDYETVVVTAGSRWKVQPKQAPVPELVTYLEGESTAPYQLTENVELSSYGSTFTVVGTKSVDMNGYNVILKPGIMSVSGDLTINNTGTAAQWGENIVALEGYDRSTKYAIKVLDGGKLTINGTNKNITIYGNAQAIMAEDGSELYLDDVNISADYNAAVFYRGNKSVIKNAVITSKSSTSHSDVNLGTSGTIANYSYAVHVSGNMTIEGTTVNGVHGAVGVLKEGTRLAVRDCDFKATGTSSHYALYVCQLAVADVFNSKFMNDIDHCVYVGNNDNTNEWGIINLYEGNKLKDKAYSQSPKTADAKFPSYIPKNSAWYTNWEVGSNEAPLPDGYTYASISEDGYNWIIKGPEGKEQESINEDVTGTTIPWEEFTTWSNSEVPTETTIATIPDQKPVVIGEKVEAEAFQVFIGGDNASLTVSEDAFLTVGDGGMNIADGGQLIIEPGAVVKVGEGGVTNSSDDAIVIKAEEGKAGAFLIGPAVTEATHPYATVEMYTKAYAINEAEHRWQHFAIPTIGKPDLTPLPHDKQEDASLIYIYEWSYDNQEWQTLDSWDKLNIPFKGYDLTNNLPETTYQTQGGVTYTFHGNIIGNGDGDLQFLSKGYNFFGNSYTAPIDIATMFNSLDGSIEKTIAIYNVEANQYVYSNKMTIDLGFDGNTQISPLQGFFLNAKTDDLPDNPKIDYEDAVYNNKNLKPGHGGLYAPAQKKEINANTVVINVEANGNADCITLVAMEDLTNDFEDGFDATKLMNNSNLNIYANTMSGKLGIVATNELEGITMDFQSNEATQYTMMFANVNGQVYDLLDVMTGARTRMEEGASYTFNAEANQKVANRFQVCAAAYAPTQMESVKAKAAQGIHTVLGQPVGNNWNALPAGVYIINGVRVVK